MDETGAAGASGSGADDRKARGAPAPDEVVAEVVGHLQTAALSMVAAVRAALDAAEHLARDPGPLFDLLSPPTEGARASSGSGAGSSSPQRTRVEHIALTPQQAPVGDDRSDGGSSPRIESDDEPVDSRDLG